jgi:hypothetical protein
MKTNFISGIIFLFLFSMPYSNASGGDENNARQPVAKPYRGIIAKGNIQVVLTKDGTQSFTVDAKNEDAASLSTYVADRALFLVRGNNTSNEPLTVYLTCRELKALETYGGAQIINTGTLNVKNIYMYVHESGIIELNLKAEKVAANVRKNGRINLKGDWDQSNICVRGNGIVMLKRGE